MKRNSVIEKIKDLKGESGHQWVIDTYNTITPIPRGYKMPLNKPWCAATVSAIFHSLGYDALAECSCSKMVEKARKLGLWVEDDSYTPKPGDVIYYDWQDNGKGDNVGEPDHVGIVIKVDGNKMTVREGNKNGSVGNREININGKFIRGFIVPPYEDDVQGLTPKKEEEAATSPTVAEKAPEKPTGASQGQYKVGNVYTISVKSALNVRKGPGKNYGVVGYSNLTSDAKKHAIGSALRPGTRVTCNEVKQNDGSVWIRIPSGWVCAVDGSRVYVK